MNDKPRYENDPVDWEKEANDERRSFDLHYSNRGEVYVSKRFDTPCECGNYVVWAAGRFWDCSRCSRTRGEIKEEG
jgi:hypothetical protein